MNITVTGRHLNISDNLKDYAEKKIKKLDRYFNQLIDAHVILTVEKLDHISEVVMNGDGVQFHGREKAADLYSSIDLLFEKMEKQIRRFKEKHQTHKGPEKGEGASIDFTDNEGKRVVLRQVSNKPVDNVEAFLQMTVDQKDFILFKKGVSKIEDEHEYEKKNYAVIFRDKSGLKMFEVPFERIDDAVNVERFAGYDVHVIDGSPANPRIEFKKNNAHNLMKLSLHEAIMEIEKSPNKFLPFFNTESLFINIIYKNGNKYEVMVPAF